MPKKPELNFEDVAFDDWAEGHNRLELPIPPPVFSGLFFLVLLVGLITFGKVADLSIRKGAFYQARGIGNVNKEINIAANRGIIFDRFGKPLVKNIPTFSVALNTSFFKNSEVVESDLVKISEALDKQSDEIKNIIQQADLERGGEIIIAHDITLEQAINLKGLGIEALRVKDDYKRQYLDGEIFSHILGYAGIAKKGNAIVGKTGLEKVYDSELRGQDGEYIMYRDVKGNILDEKMVKQSKAGFQLNTTIDGDFQRYFYERFRQGLISLDRTTGVGLAINPKTGEVLALLSFPTFDNNDPAKYLNSKNQALFNRAISGVYSPGSTIKPFFALAALKENIIIPTDSFYSKGYLELPNPYNPDKPSRFLDWKAHGYVDLYSALAKSSNVYFYIIGGGFGSTKGLGVAGLQKYWDKFDLGKKTGIDLPAENKGFFYGPEEKEERTGDFWRIGNTYNVSIGQGDLALTPIRLLSAISFIAADGKGYKPFVARSIIDERDNIVNLNEPQKTLDYPELEAMIYEVKKGLRDAVKMPYGTANMLFDLPIPVAGKTGSAQIANNTKINAFFIGYAPADDPVIAILILVEDARQGSINTLPIAYDVLKWYYYNRM